MAEAKESKVQSAQQAAVEDKEERKAYKCQYCDRMFATSQALGGHQNGHRRERDAVKRAEHEAELYAAHAAPPLPPMYPAPPYPHPRQQQLLMHHAAAAARNVAQFRPWPPLPGPPQHYHHSYQAPHDHHFIRANRELPPLRVDPRYGMVRPHFLASSSHGGGAHAARVEEEQWRSVYCHRNYSGYAMVATARAELAAQANSALAAMEGPSWAPTNMNLGFRQDQERAEGAENKRAVNKEIDLTLRL